MNKEGTILYAAGDSLLGKKDPSVLADLAIACAKVGNTDGFRMFFERVAQNQAQEQSDVRGHAVPIRSKSIEEMHRVSAQIELQPGRPVSLPRRISGQ